MSSFHKVPSVTLDMVTHFPPIHMRLDEVLAQDTLRILCKPDSDPLRQTLTTLWLDPDYMSRRLNPPQKMRNALKLSKITSILGSVEKTSTPCNVDSGVSPLTVIRNETFGASGTRTNEQKERALERTRQLIAEISPNEPVGFSDGSALGNPGPCGASLILYTEGIQGQPVTIKEAVSYLSSSYHGELVGIRLVTQLLRNLSSNSKFEKAHLFCDCISAISSRTSSTIHTSHQGEIDTIRANIKYLMEINIKVIIYWVPGHVNLAGNELADAAAKEADQEASESGPLVSQNNL